MNMAQTRPLDVGGGCVMDIGPSIARYFAMTANTALYGESDILQRTEIDHWLTYTLGPLSCQVEFEEALKYLDSILEPSTYLVGKTVSIADYVVYGFLFTNGQWLVRNNLQTITQSSKILIPKLIFRVILKEDLVPRMVLRWYEFIGSLPEVTKVTSKVPKEGIPKPIAAGSIKKSAKNHPVVMMSQRREENQRNGK